MGLNQVGEILGLTSKEILDIHRSLAEEAFRKKAEAIITDGALTEGIIEQLNKVQEEVGLPPQYAQSDKEHSNKEDGR